VEALDAALLYAAKGWPVFPVMPGGKAPLGRLVPHGLHDASIDPPIITGWWTKAPEANIGLRTGVGFDVVDIDGQEGLDNLAEIRKDAPMAWGPEAVTGSGWHLLHLPTGEGNRTGIVPKVDYRGQGGYIVAPPSLHASGRHYEWATSVGAGIDEELEPLPTWIAELLLTPKPVAKIHRARKVSDAYGRRALEAEVGRCALAAPGGRNHQLNASAFSLGQLVAAGNLDAAEVVDALMGVAGRIGLGDSESAKTIRSGLSSGMSQPRNITT